jgi:hypothetical protein
VLFCEPRQGGKEGIRARYRLHADEQAMIPGTDISP